MGAIRQGAARGNTGVGAAEGEPTATDSYVLVACHHVLRPHHYPSTPPQHHRIQEAGPSGSDRWDRCLLDTVSSSHFSRTPPTFSPPQFFPLRAIYSTVCVLTDCYMERRKKGKPWVLMV